LNAEDEREFRRAEVLKLDVEGLSEREIASKLMVSNGTVHSDLVYLRQKAKENISLYVDDKLPSEYEKCLRGINQILKEAWNTSRDTEDRREKIISQAKR
jgi:orotate phosphoribosyltransferase-like protein